jgi:hypothetical protein
MPEVTSHQHESERDMTPETVEEVLLHPGVGGAASALTTMTPRELAALGVGPCANLLPPATEEADAALEMSVREKGVLNAVVVYRDEEGSLRIADGARRRDAAVSLGIDCPVREIENPGGEELRRIRCINSVGWRGTGKGAMVRHFLQASQETAGLSCELASREIKALFGIDVTRQTVSNIRRDIEGEEGVPPAAGTVRGADGRERPGRGRRGVIHTVARVDPNIDASGVDEEEVGRDLAARGFEMPERGERSGQEADGDTSESLSVVRSRLKELVALVPEERRGEADALAGSAWRGALEVCRTQARAACAIDDAFWNTVNAQWATIRELRTRRNVPGTEDPEDAAV